VGSHAGVSSTTFYEVFEASEACLLAAYETAAERVFGCAHPVAVGEHDWSERAGAALAALLVGLASDPDAGRLLFVEGLSGGRRIGQARKGVAQEFERRVQAFLDSPPTDEGTLDIPAIAVMGALRNIVCRHLRTHSEERLPSMAADGVAWLESYGRQSGAGRWSASERALLPVTKRPAPGRLPRSQRERILQGAAEVTMAKGYANATVRDMIAQAGASREVFDTHFAGKQHVFLEAQQDATKELLDACALAYFSAATWPERVWRCLGTLLRVIAANPALSHLRLVACYTAGPGAIRRAEEITRSFSFFLEEGYGNRSQNRELPRLYSEAISGAIFEILQRQVALGECTELPRRLPQLSYIALAPFMGAEEAVRLIEELSARELAGHQRRGAAVPSGRLDPMAWSPGLG
jgi:AcrR family transcriptional regulator